MTNTLFKIIIKNLTHHHPERKPFLVSLLDIKFNNSPVTFDATALAYKFLHRKNVVFQLVFVLLLLIWLLF